MASEISVEVITFWLIALQQALKTPVELVRIGLLSQSNCRVVWIDLLHGCFPISYRRVLKTCLCVSFYVYEDKLPCTIEFSCTSTSLLVGNWPCFAYNIFHVWWVLVAWLIVVWRFEFRTLCIISLRIKLLSACQRDAKMSLILSEAKKVALHCFCKHYLRPCTKNIKKLLILYSNQPMEDHKRAKSQWKLPLYYRPIMSLNDGKFIAHIPMCVHYLCFLWRYLIGIW